MTNVTSGVGRAFGNCMYIPRKRIAACLLILLAGMFTLIVYNTFSSRLVREEKMEEHIAGMQNKLQFIESQYHVRQEQVLTLQSKVSKIGSDSSQAYAISVTSTTLKPELVALLKNLSGTKAAEGVRPKRVLHIQTMFVYQLLPHLMEDPRSLHPAYHMQAGKPLAEVVIGIPTVKRDKESYLLITLAHLIDGLSASDVNSTLIVVMVGEVDLEYVIDTARKIETMFPKEVSTGLIEVLSPSPSYYPDFDSLPITLGDSHKRVKWRTKQNLDTIYLMAYAHSKGTFYLMLEDDIIAKKNYMQDIKRFAASTTVVNPHWFYIQYCTVGGIGKLFRSSDLIRFITYVQLFYNNMPIDWLLESYLADRICGIDKNSKDCGESKAKIRPTFKNSLFQHIGLYSSLRGKIQKVKDSHFGFVPTFHPHNNPPLVSVKTNIEVHTDHTLKKAYDGTSFFWGIKPKREDFMEFYFAEPTTVQKYTFRSGNVEHVSDKLYDGVVEVLPVNGNFTTVNIFDEFGLAEGELRKELGPLSAIRLRITKDSKFWLILSEIEVKPFKEADKR